MKIKAEEISSIIQKQIEEKSSSKIKKVKEKQSSVHLKILDLLFEYS